MAAVKGFNAEKTLNEIVDDTLLVHSDGSVSFRTRYGKGSGKPIEISGDQFDKFVSQMSEIASRREMLAKVASTKDSE